MIFLDTSVWVASFYDRHPHHAPSRRLLATLRPQSTACAAHSLAEVYTTLTRLPAAYRAHPRAAIDVLNSMAQRTNVVSLDSNEYLAALDEASTRGLSGGVVYDALLLTCARKVKAKRIYTWNVRHFRAVAPQLAECIVTPEA